MAANVSRYGSSESSILNLQNVTERSRCVPHCAIMALEMVVHQPSLAGTEKTKQGEANSHSKAQISRALSPVMIYLRSHDQLHFLGSEVDYRKLKKGEAFIHRVNNEWQSKIIPNFQFTKKFKMKKKKKKNWITSVLYHRY